VRYKDILTFGKSGYLRRRGEKGSQKKLLGGDAIMKKRETSSGWTGKVGDANYVGMRRIE